MNHRNDHGDFCTWQYNAPAKRARGYWHGTDPIMRPLWAYAMRSTCGTFWDLSSGESGFDDEESAINAARCALATRTA